MLLRGAFRDLSTKGSACGRDLAVFGLLLAVLTVWPIGAAEPDPGSQTAAQADSRFASGVQLIEVYVTVTDRDGQLVTGLTKEDFTVYENEQRQAISVFTAGNAPLSVAVALDRSFSMAGERLQMMKRATDTFLDALAPADQAMLIGIGSTVDVLATLSTDRAAQHRAVQAIDAFGSTSLRDAIVTAFDRIEPASGRRALVLLSDGVDRYSHASEADALERARHADVLAYPIALAKTRPPLFVDLAIATGGRSAQVTDPRRLGEALTIIAQELRHQYLLGYMPAHGARERDRPEWRGLRVEVSRPGVTLRARPGYWTK
jgi:Ca-activated chloride channel homolog